MTTVPAFVDVLDAVLSYPKDATLPWVTASVAGNVYLKVLEGPCARFPWCWQVGEREWSPADAAHALRIDVPADRLLLHVDDHVRGHHFVLALPVTAPLREDLHLPEQGTPPPPWKLTAKLGWSADAVSSELAAWVATVGRADLQVVSAQAPVQAPLTVGDGVYASSDAVGHLLTCAAAEIDEVNGVLTRLVDGLRDTLSG